MSGEWKEARSNSERIVCGEDHFKVLDDKD